MIFNNCSSSGQLPPDFISPSPDTFQELPSIPPPKHGKMGAVQVHKMCTKSAKAKIKVTLSPCIVHKSRMDQKLQSKIRGDQEYKEWTKKFHKTNLKFSPPSKHLPSHFFKWTTSSKESSTKTSSFLPYNFFFSTADKKADNCIPVQKVKFSHISQRNKISYMGNHLSSFPYC